MNAKFNNKYLLAISITIAIVLSFALKSLSLDDLLIDLAVEDNLSYFSKALDNEPVETKAILLDYADNQELVLKSFIALKKYPKFAESIFVTYGQEPEFKKAIIRYGDGVVPVVDYFLKNEVTMLTVQETASNLWQALQGKLSENKPIVAEVNSQQRGWYAINEDGYNFLGQFAVDKNNNTHWIQSDRTTKAVTDFFTGGIRELEMKYKTNEEITNGDILWAGVDVIALASTVKLLKASKGVSTTSKSLSVTKKTSLFSAKLIQNKTLQNVLKYSAVATTAYIVIKHPSVINSMLDESAKLLGIRPELVKIVGWFLLLFPVLWIINGFALPLIWLVLSGRKIIAQS
jgi:hypothetical protein